MKKSRQPMNKKLYSSIGHCEVSCGHRSTFLHLLLDPHQGSIALDFGGEVQLRRMPQLLDPVPTRLLFVCRCMPTDPNLNVTYQIISFFFFYVSWI